ncbi:MAG: M15 family metallopeptidase [Acidimicrobiia bacterium]
MRPALILAALALVSCSTPPQSVDTTVPVAPTRTSTTTTLAPTTTTTVPTTTTTIPTTTTTTLPEGVTPPPDWLGTRPLPVDENGVGLAQPTPPEMVDRRFTSPDLLPPPADGEFHSTTSEVLPEVMARSTWVPECPVDIDELSYLTLSFWGFDQKPHTGEIIVNAMVAEDVIEVFARLFEAKYPIEEIGITTPADLEADPTGDGNVTESFVCRPVTGGSGWSQHAYGLAIDLNPFHNPYWKGDVVLPELSSAYLDRGRQLPGMIFDGDVVTSAFDDIGWGWGGRWNSLKDWQHFSRSGT